jgi:peptidoglycan/LPS O-acetylase OafA/YrhL
MPTQTVQLNKQAISWWVALVVLIGALLMATGAVLAFVHPAMLVSPHEEINSAVRVYAGYLTARNAVLAGMLIALLAIRARRALGNLMAIVAFIQFLDAVMDILEGRWALVPGVLVFGLVYLITATRLSGYPFWRSEAWTG